MTDKELNALNAEYDTARARFNTAMQDLGKALADLHHAAGDMLRTEAAMSDCPWAVYAGHAHSNRSEWSGGPITVTNISELTKRQAALYLLHKETMRCK
jgi:hypothetical protein